MSANPTEEINEIRKRERGGSKREWEREREEGNNKGIKELVFLLVNIGDRERERERES